MSNLGERLKRLRQELGLSQAAIGAEGFVSTPGWIKIENGLRAPSDRLIGRLVDWLKAEKHIQPGAVAALRLELLARKYLDSNAAFLRELAKSWLADQPWGLAILRELEAPAAASAKRGRPAGSARP